MAKVNCDVICDLIPLCKDKVASESSEELVKDHILTCESCRKEYYDDASSEPKEIELKTNQDKKIIKSIRLKSAKIMAVLFFAGAVLGVILTGGMGVFFNFMIMPLIGIMAYVAFRPRFYIAPVSIGVLALIYGIFYEGFIYYLPYALIYAALILVGYFIGFLFRFALFGKETNPKKILRLKDRETKIAIAVTAIVVVAVYVLMIASNYTGV